MSDIIDNERRRDSYMSDKQRIEAHRELRHFGVKGMRWGVRKNSQNTAGETSVGSPAKKTKRQPSERKEKLKRAAKVGAAAGAASAIALGAGFVGHKLGSKDKYTMDQMNLYAARQAGNLAVHFIKDNIDFNVALNEVRLIERGHRDRVGHPDYLEVRHPSKRR